IIYLHTFPTRRSSDLLSAKTDATKVLILNNESAAGTNTPEIQQIDPIHLNIQTGKTVYAAAKDGNWSLLNLNSGNSWFPINLKRSEEHTSELQSRENL